ncbi:MAG: trypsin-like peptidase domain-containing protein, partial [Putridiphycobacter sp.]|nr:trypsin-like peptidase domain-containing protein [Putridiphycobacter sp.]
MKQILTIFTILMVFQLWSQSDTDMPYTYSNSLYHIEMTQLYEGEALDITALLEEDLKSESNFPRAGIIQPVELTLYNSGTWYDLLNGDKLWRLKLKIPNALAVSAYFNSFYIPEGGKLFAYAPNYDEVLPAYTAEINPETGFYATDYVHGETIILEYYEPRAVSGQSAISISGVNGFYDMIPPKVSDRPTGDNRAGTCQVDVNCSEGDAWRRQRDGVVRITVVSNGNTGFCSGSLVNNTAEDCTPYILSAHHCATDDNDINATPSDFAQWLFRFNFQHKDCTSPLIIGSYSKTGCTKIANSTNNGGILGSDYLLVELTEDLDESKTPYFNGWDATGAGSQSGVAIHHPAGDEKKISTYDQALVSSFWANTPTPNGSHWQVKWIATANGWGVSEGGSSGSPIFNSNGLIVGQLSGGQSECADVNPNGQTLPDLYGKMSYNWTGQQNVDLIGPYLDPIGNGTTKTMPGNYYLCSQGTGVVNHIDEFEQ